MRPQCLTVIRQRLGEEIYQQIFTLILSALQAHGLVGGKHLGVDSSVMEANASLRDGLKRLREAGADVVLINPQYAPKVITKHDVDGMVDLIHLTAKETNVDLFERFAVMRYWRLTEDIPFSTFISPDELHMNDWSYGCIAKLLAQAIQEAATRTTVTATATAHGRQ